MIADLLRAHTRDRVDQPSSHHWLTSLRLYKRRILRPRLIAMRMVLAVSLGILASCGAQEPDYQSQAKKIALEVTLSSNGTLVACHGPADWQYKLERSGAEGYTAQVMRCPSVLFRALDYTLSHWKLAATPPSGNTPLAVVLADTRLPAPQIIPNGTEWIVQRHAPMLQEKFFGLKLLLQSADGAVLQSFADPSKLAASDIVAGATNGVWRWALPVGTDTFYSDLAPAFSVQEAPLGFWGALAVGDANGDGIEELFGTTGTGNGFVATGYDTAVQSALFTDRDFREVRLVDLNGDGLDDIVSNVYGGGCTMIGLAQASGGGYDFRQPLRRDGSCIGGHGETLVVADFDSDGLPDIVVPSYERLDYIHNDGHGHFTEMADAVGLSLAFYIPAIEGAAAVDIDLNGTVDIVLGSEVLLNNGSGHFNAVSMPFGTTMQDEGLSVADIDGDGVYDVAKNHPEFGLRPFWGQADRVHFTDSGYVGGSYFGSPVPQSLGAFGIAVGRFTGGALSDVVLAGGNPTGTPPRLCVQAKPRALNCLTSALPAQMDATGDLLMLADLNADGQTEMISRTGQITIYSAPLRKDQRFRFDIRDSAGLRNQQGRSLRARCALDDSLIELRFIDGGNGYMANTGYVVPITSSWCSSVSLDIFTKAGVKAYGPYDPGSYTLRAPL